MSLYIPGLNLPLANQELWIAIQSDGSFRYNSCGWQNSQQKAIVVQSHGRLIDSDALIKELTLDDKDDNSGASLLMAIFLEVLKAVPTVIPATEGE